MKSKSKQQTKQQNQLNYKYATLAGTSLQTRVVKRGRFSERIFNSEQWDLGDRLYRDQNMNHAFKYMTKCSATVLKLDYNKYPNIIKSISQPSFPNLTNLQLGDNTIVSIEYIRNLQMPNLLFLHLNDNPICKISSLRKANIPKILLISLRETLIKDQTMIHNLCELDAPNLLTISLDYRNTNILQYKRNWLAKTNWVTKWRQQKQQKYKQK